MDEAEGHAADCPQGHEAIEHRCLTDRPGESPPFAEESGHSDRSRPGQHGNGKKATADEPDGEEEAGEGSSKGPERLSGLGGTFDVGLSVGVQSGGGGHDDGEHDEIGKRHARENVEATCALLALHLGRAGLLLEGENVGSSFGLFSHFFEAMGSLPEEQIRRDGGP